MKFSFCAVAAPCLLGLAVASAQVPAAQKLTPNLIGELERPLRYRPDGTDFVIENGTEFFNRPLYGGNTAFRADAGDRPEFTLYLPGRGGNLRLGVKSSTGAKWLHGAEQVTARYRPGMMRYEIRDPLLGAAGVIQLAVIALPMTDGLIVRVDANGVPSGLELIWAYGGVTGQRGRRDGDIGTENVPIGQYFQLKPEFCRDNAFTLSGANFTLRSKTATLFGVAPSDANLRIGSAKDWDAPAALFAADGPNASESPNEFPLVIGQVALVTDRPLYLAVQRLADETANAGTDLDIYREVTADRPGVARPTAKLNLLPEFAARDLPRIFAEGSAHFDGLRTHVAVETPDPFLNAAAAALNVAADAVWDEPQRAIMHGAIAWRTKLLGWRGPYLLDALGWPERAREHFKSWAARQNTDPIPEKIPSADNDANLARNETALHSNGDLSNSHYDMNTVYIDALFRHLRWTGDLDLARELWPVIERHLAWERRLFRREFGPEKLPLYEAYAVIWASDDLQYSGGGATHSSAYNYWHNRMAAQLAKKLGESSAAAAYDREADLIAKAMRQYLWMPDRGMFAEFKDLLGRQLVHPSAGLWTFYHTLDAELVTREEALAMSRYVDAELPHLPVHGPGVPTDADYHVLATTNWMPYSWSINNVVMGENMHTALGFWQAGRAEEAYRLTKGSLLASMFMGISPGNVGSMNYLDVYRRESQRDFADGSGVLSRALVEGLFGVQPDALNGVLHLSPGFPSAWTHAKLGHPNLNFEFRREGEREIFTLEPRFAQPLEVRLQIFAQRQAARVTVNGREVAWKKIDFDRANPRLEIPVPPMARAEIVVTWSGAAIEDQKGSLDHRSFERRVTASQRRENLNSAQLDPVDLTSVFNDRVTEIFRKGKYLSPRSPYASLALPSQGIGAWAGHVQEMAEIDDRGLRAAAASHGGRFVLPNGLSFVVPSEAGAKNVLFTSQWDNYPREATMPLTGRAKAVHLLMAGSTNFMQSRIDNGEAIVAYTDGTSARLALHNPTTWWPIEQDYFIDDYQFKNEAPLPIRVDLKTGQVRELDLANFKGKGRHVEGGAATVLDLPLDETKELRSITVRSLANDVVIGLMGVTLER